MKNNLFNIDFQKEIITLSLFFATFITFLLFGDFDFLLTDFLSIQVSQATRDGVDIAKRVSFFYKAICCFTISLVLIYVGVFHFKQKQLLNLKELKTLSILSVIGICLIFATAFGVESEKGVRLLFYLISLIIGLSFLKTRVTIFRLFLNETYLGGILIVSFISLGLSVFLFNSDEFIISNSSSLYVAITIIFLLLTFLIKKHLNIFSNKLFLGGLPIILVPVFIFLSIEFVFYFEEHFGFFIPFKKIFLGVLLFVFVIWLSYIKIKPIRISTTRLLACFYAPSALLIFLIFTIYYPVIEQSNELFELANPAISQMRIFQFNELPLVDFMSSHMFSEQFYGIIYNLFHGYNGSLDFLIFKFLYLVIFYFSAYWFLLKLLKSALFALLFLILFPLMFNLFHHHMFYSVLVFFAIQKVVYSQKTKNYLLFGSSLVFICVWRLDVGVSAIIASLFFLPITFFVSRTEIEAKQVFKSLGIFILLIAVIAVPFLIIKSPEYLMINVSNALHYLSANQAHGLTVITHDFNHQFFVHYVLFPLISVLIILYSIFNLRADRVMLKTFRGFSLSSSIFFFLTYLANFQRGLVRHSFAENTDSFLMSTFFLALVLFLISFIKEKSHSWRFISFFGGSLLLIFLLKYFPLGKEVSGIDKFLTNPTILNIDKIFNDENYKGRVVGEEEFAKNNYADLKLFLDKNLSKEQSFLDFSNTPMLYYYCNRNVPSYFCQNLQNTVDDYLQVEQIKRIDPAKIPVVIYSNHPKSWWDNTDGVSNIMRQYLLAEHIHKNYKPFAVINNHSVWISKDVELDNSGYVLDEDLNLPQEFNYQNAGWLINNYIKKELSNSFERVVLKKFDVRLNENEALLSVQNMNVERTNLFVKIILEKSLENQDLKIELFAQEKLIGSNVFRTNKNELEYMMPLSNHYLWFKNPVSLIKVLSTEQFKIKDIQFFKDIRSEY